MRCSSMRPAICDPRGSAMAMSAMPSVDAPWCMACDGNSSKVRCSRTVNTTGVGHACDTQCRAYVGNSSLCSS